MVDQVDAGSLYHACHGVDSYACYFLFKIKTSLQLKPKLHTLYLVVVEDSMVKWLMKAMCKGMHASYVCV